MEHKGKSRPAAARARRRLRNRLSGACRNKAGRAAERRNGAGGRGRIYHSTSDQRYGRGPLANRKFRLPNLSHTVFRWRLLATILSFRALKLSHSLVPAAINPARRLRAMGIGALVEDKGLDVRMVRAFGPPQADRSGKGCG